MGAAEARFHERLAGMGERAVAHIMEKGSDHHQQAVVLLKTKLPGGDTGQVHRPHRMFKTRVVGPGIDKVPEAELVDIPQALDGRGIQELQDLLVHLNIAMNRILDDLGTH